MQVSRELSELGWSGNHEYMCLILQITYLNQQNLSTKAICRYIKKKFEDSVSFLYQDEIVVFFDLTRLGMTQEDVADLVEKNFPNLKGKVEINHIGTTIGSHTGPGTVALFFWGCERTE